VASGPNAIASGANSTALGADTKATASGSVALGQGSVADRANTISVGAAGSERQITNVAAGTQTTDAVNVGQLNQGLSQNLSEANQYTNNAFAGSKQYTDNAVAGANAYTDSRVNSAVKDARGGIASAIATANLPQAFIPGKGMISVAGGTYSGQSAVALGISKASENGRWVVKGSASSDTRGNFGAGAGVGFHW
jgi:autotransporter adhesin